MFDTLLIANRGEIACRIMQTARAMGIRCVAVYSDADAGARHVEMADLAVRIGGPAPADSYLDIPAILAAAEATGAEAIHPGYGFLSENPDFVEAVTAAGLVFVGPSADAIRAMGLKDAAKALMEKAGVPVVRGYQGDDQSPDHLAAEAARIGYPVLIKAVAGGGGKGMRRVDDPQQFAAALDSAQSEARKAFGNAHVLIESYVARPRHIEVQIFGDGTRAVHLFERDCSLQRRHQKVIEEAPAPGMTAEMREAMGAAAVRAAEAIGYAGAGTVEFIVDASDGLHPDRFFFMEMNTRLQVEHPVTEAITGVDLVEWQLRVAANEPLPARQEDLGISGHAFEARLYAEDVPAGFLPATGRLAHLVFPEDARIDTAVRSGDEISPWYDPMIAKITVHGATRAAALGRLRRALRATEVAGTVTNLAFLGALARHPGFSAGDVETGLIERDLSELANPPRVGDLQILAAGLGAAGLDLSHSQAGFTLWQPLRHKVSLAQDEVVHDLTVEVAGTDRLIWRYEGRTLEILRRSGLWWFGQQKLPATFVTGVEVTVLDGDGHRFLVPDLLTRGAEDGAGTDQIEAPMPGLVRRIFASPGERVKRGERLAVLEAMKMEHTLTAARDGEVAEILAAPGQQVSAGDVLIRLAPEPETTDEAAPA